MSNKQGNRTKIEEEAWYCWEKEFAMMRIPPNPHAFVMGYKAAMNKFTDIPDPEQWVSDMKAENERLKKELFKANLQNDNLQMRTEALELKKELSFDLCRSFISVCERSGESTNWDAIKHRCKEALKGHE